MKPVGIFSERDFIKAIARDGAAVLGVEVQQLMSTPVLTCRPSDRIDAVLATTTTARIRHFPVIEGNELKGKFAMDTPISGVRRSRSDDLAARDIC
jgi:CBS domain-containing protein